MITHTLATVKASDHYILCVVLLIFAQQFPVVFPNLFHRDMLHY